MQELSLHVLDLVQNAVEAGADRVQVEIEEDEAADRLRLVITDNGKGMEAAQAAQLTDPFYTTRTSRRVGMGVPLLAAAAEATGGELRVQSAPGRGTTVEVRFGLSHLDRAPLGDMGATIATALVGRPGLELVYRHRAAAGEYVFDTEALRRELGEVPLDQPAVTGWIGAEVRRGLADIGSIA